MIRIALALLSSAAAGGRGSLDGPRRWTRSWPGSTRGPRHQCRYALRRRHPRRRRPARACREERVRLEGAASGRHRRPARCAPEVPLRLAVAGAGLPDARGSPRTPGQGPWNSPDGQADRVPSLALKRLRKRVRARLAGNGQTRSTIGPCRPWSCSVRQASWPYRAGASRPGCYATQGDRGLLKRAGHRGPFPPRWRGRAPSGGRTGRGTASRAAPPGPGRRSPGCRPPACRARAAGPPAPALPR